MSGNETVKSFKAFNNEWKCRGFQYEVGKSYEHAGEVKACESGFHACEYPLDVFNYYSVVNSKFATVEQEGDLSRQESDSKVASRKITIKAAIDIPGLISAAIEYTTNRCEPHGTGDSSASSATGDSSASSATGDSSASSATGYSSASSATGYRSASSATGYSSASSATGYRSASSATGYSSASSATGDSSASSATGYRSASSATGYSSASSATGDSSAAISTGPESSSEVGKENSHSIAVAAGYQSKAKAAIGCAIVCVYRNDDGELIHIRASKVGDNGIKPGVFYALDSNGNFIEV